MKVTFALFFAAAIIGLLSPTEALKFLALRGKRAVAREYCPKNSSADQCEDYAKAISKTIQHCHNYSIHEQLIEWMSCGTVSCEGNLKIVEEDLSKPYPDCCKSCELSK